ncbi:hypothetical protein KCP70_10285 [Salmonella enterica subsp. enterica]|nr:hypothetical protein KCP70_10285 [Salmonella enterica subsp. enterica]
MSPTRTLDMQLFRVKPGGAALQTLAHRKLLLPYFRTVFRSFHEMRGNTFRKEFCLLLRRWAVLHLSGAAKPRR